MRTYRRYAGTRAGSPRHAGHRPPAFVRRIGCAFGAMIVCAALGTGTLVSFFAHVSRGVQIAAAVLAVVFVMVMAAAFATTFRRATRFFREQDRLRRQLLADVAHELRTPLSILQGRIEGMLDGVYPPDREHLSDLLTETRHLSRLVEDVRTVANAEAGALDLQKESVDVGELIRETAGAIAAPVAVDVPDDLPRIDADPVRIREVLLNLLTNAEATGTKISVAAEATTAAVVIRVHDEGPGIPADELPHVFERFRKGRESGGSGLGLAIARRLVTAHGGSIDIESAPDRGTTVAVLLPR